MKAGLLASALLLAAAGAVPGVLPGQGLPPLAGFPVAASAVQDASMAMAGLRRMGGDVAYIELLQYLSGGEGLTHAAHDDEHGEGHGDSHAGWLPRALPLSRRTLSLSPYFHAAHLLAAGTLGFVLDRPKEAVALLLEAAQSDPTFWRYRLYAGAVAYKDNESPEKVIALLEEALKYPDCPSMLQNILANLHKKAGHPARAAQIYAFTIETSKDAAAVHHARLQLEKLRAQGLIP